MLGAADAGLAVQLAHVLHHRARQMSPEQAATMYWAVAKAAAKVENVSMASDLPQATDDVISGDQLREQNDVARRERAWEEKRGSASSLSQAEQNSRQSHLPNVLNDANGS